MNVRAIADTLENNNISRYVARREQAARRLGVGLMAATRAQTSAARSGDPRSPRRHSSGAVRAAVSRPAEIAVIALLCAVVLAPFVWLGWLLGQQ